VKKTGCLHVHNYHCNGTDALLRFPHILTTLEEMTGSVFDPSTLRRELVFRDKVLFYNAETSMWPPVCKRVPHEGQSAYGEMVTVPAMMEDLADCDCSHSEAIVLDMVEVHEWEARSNGDPIDILDYKTLTIESAYGGDINLFEQCTNGTYAGFDPLHDHEWAKYSGLASLLDVKGYMRSLGSFEHFDDTLEMLTTDNSAVEELAQDPELDSLLERIESPPSWSQDNARAVRHDSPVRSRSRSRSPVRSRSRSPERWGKCSFVVDWDSDGQDVLCGEDCSPSEQICHRCRRGLY